MFSSNQMLSVSGSIEDGPSEIVKALDFALDVWRGDRRTSTDDKLVFQIVGKTFHLGWFFDDIPKGWEKFGFYVDTEIIARIILKFIEKQDMADSVWFGCDGSFEKGFLMSSFSSKDFNNVQSPEYGIVGFEPFTAFYEK